MIRVICTDCPIERTGYHRALVHITNGGLRDGQRAIYGVGVARSCVLVAVYRGLRVARCNLEKWARDRQQDNARRYAGLPLFGGGA